MTSHILEDTKNYIYTILYTFVYSDDQIMFRNEEGELIIFHISSLNNSPKFNEYLKTKTKTKVMAFQGKFPIQRNICIQNLILDKVSPFKYLGYNLTYIETVIYLRSKIQNDDKALKIINPSSSCQNYRVIDL